MLWHARWSATKLDEQAVSTTKLGPRRSQIHEIRLASEVACNPVADSAGALLERKSYNGTSSRNSSRLIKPVLPTNSPVRISVDEAFVVRREVGHENSHFCPSDALER